MATSSSGLQLLKVFGGLAVVGALVFGFRAWQDAKTRGEWVEKVAKAIDRDRDSPEVRIRAFRELRNGFAKLPGREKIEDENVKLQRELLKAHQAHVEQRLRSFNIHWEVVQPHIDVLRRDLADTNLSAEVEKTVAALKRVAGDQWSTAILAQQDSEAVALIAAARKDLGEPAAFTETENDIYELWSRRVIEAARACEVRGDMSGAFEALASDDARLSKLLDPERARLRDVWTNAKVATARQLFGDGEYDEAREVFDDASDDARFDVAKLAAVREDFTKQLRDRVTTAAAAGRPRRAMDQARREFAGWIPESDPLFGDLERQLAALIAERFGGERAIDTSGAQAVIDRLDDVEVDEQLRDWALAAAYVALDPLPDAAGVALGSRPPLRLSELEGLNMPDFGPGRLAMVADNACVVLAPTSARAADGDPRFGAIVYQLLDDLRAADGVVPETVYLAWYELSYDEDELQRRIAIKGLDTRQGREFYTSGHGYVTAEVDSGKSLQKLLASVDTLLEISAKSDALTIRGRSFRPDTFALDYRRVDVNDVRVIYEAMTKHSVYLPLIIAYLSEDEKFRALDDAEKKTQAERFWHNLGASERNEIEDFISGASEIAFSLDPWINSRQLGEGLKELRAGIKESLGDEAAELFEGLDEVLAKLAVTSSFAIPNDIDGDVTGLFAFFDDRAEARAKVFDDVDPFDMLLQQCQFQAPRYEGGIAGTAVGHTLYFTDLTAKLFALGSTTSDDEEFDAADEAQEAAADGDESVKADDKPTIVTFSRESMPEVPGFEAATDIELTAFHEREFEANSRGRLWWGVDPAAIVYTHAAGGRLGSEPRDECRFAANVMRLHMRSKSSELAVEVEANPRYRRYCDSFNRHYLEIASAEPEFMRLNVLFQVMSAMKLGLADRSSGWSFLSTVPLKPASKTFDEWYQGAVSDKQTKILLTLPFVKIEGAPSDALEKLRSGMGYSGVALAGGVTGPSQSELRTSKIATDPPAPSRGFPREVDRSRWSSEGYRQDGAIPTRSGGTFRITHDGSEVRIDHAVPLKTPRISTVSTTLTSEQAAEATMRVIVRETPGKAGETTAEFLVADGGGSGKPPRNAGRLTVSSPENPNDPFKIGFVEGGENESRRVMQAAVSEAVLNDSPTVRIDSNDPTRVYVKLKNENDAWLEIRRGTDEIIEEPGTLVGLPGDQSWVHGRVIREGDLPPNLVADKSWLRFEAEDGQSTLRPALVSTRPIAETLELKLNASDDVVRFHLTEPGLIGGGLFSFRLPTQMFLADSPAVRKLPQLTADRVTLLRDVLSNSERMPQGTEVNLKNGGVMAKTGESQWTLYDAKTPFADSILATADGQVSDGLLFARGVPKEVLERPQIEFARDLVDAAETPTPTFSLFYPTDAAGRAEAQKLVKLFSEHPELAPALARLDEIDLPTLESAIAARTELKNRVTFEARLQDDAWQLVDKQNKPADIADSLAAQGDKTVALRVDTTLPAEQQLNAALRVQRAARPAGGSDPAPRRVVIDTGIKNAKGQTSAERLDGLLNWRSVEFRADADSINQIADKNAGRVLTDMLTEREYFENDGALRVHLLHADASGDAFQRLTTEAASGKLTGHEIVIVCSSQPERALQFRQAALENGAQSVVINSSKNAVDVVAAGHMLQRLGGQRIHGTPLDALKASYAEVAALLKKCKELPEADRAKFLENEFGVDIMQFYEPHGGPTDRNLDNVIRSSEEDPSSFSEHVDADLQRRLDPYRRIAVRGEMQFRGLPLRAPAV